MKIQSKIRGDSSFSLLMSLVNPSSSSSEKWNVGILWDAKGILLLLLLFLGEGNGSSYNHEAPVSQMNVNSWWGWGRKSLEEPSCWTASLSSWSGPDYPPSNTQFTQQEAFLQFELLLVKMLLLDSRSSSVNTVSQGGRPIMELGCYTAERDHGTQTPEFHPVRKRSPRRDYLACTNSHLVSPTGIWVPRVFQASGPVMLTEEKDNGCGLPFLFYNANFFCLSK